MNSKLDPHINDIQSWLNAGQSFRDMARRLCLQGVIITHETVRRFVETHKLTPGGVTPTLDVTATTVTSTVTSPGVTPPDVTAGVTPPLSRVTSGGVVPRNARRCPAPPGADVDAADARATEVSQRVNIPAGYSIYPCPTQFFPWAEAEARDWFQVVTPGGGETTLSASELLEKFGPRPA